MADLLKQFVTEPWVNDLDFSRMKPVKTKFQVPGLPKRESDVIWQIPLQSGGNLYLLVLLEFQSKVDRWMILRVIVYICMLWLQLLAEKRVPSQGPLPPVMPVLLYNGETPWLMPVRLRDLIDLPDNSPLWKFQPDGQFFLIDEGRYSREDLDQRDSLSALVFQLEQCKNLDDLPALATKIIAWLERWPEFETIKQTIAAMFKNTVASLTKDQSILSETFDLLETPTMLQTRIETWKNEKKREWMQEGEQKGVKKGVKKGKAKMLLHLLTQRFGDLSAKVHEKVHAADLNTLDLWGDRVLAARSLEDVFITLNAP